MSSDFNRPSPSTLDLLLTRRSGSAKAMTGPGPDKAQLADILKAGARAPDHGKLFPWRFIVFEGDARERAGDIIAEAAKADGERDKQVEEERARFLRAPVVIGVVSAAREQHKIPVWEQELSCGAAGMNLVLAAHALGYVAGWVTGWYAYSDHVRSAFCGPGERIGGFIFIGHAGRPLEERDRAPMATVWKPWRPSAQ